MTPSLVQPPWESDSNHVLRSHQAAVSHDEPVTAVFRGGKSLEIRPGLRLDEVEAAYRTLMGFPARLSPNDSPRWRTPAEAYADEQAAKQEAAN